MSVLRRSPSGYNRSVRGLRRQRREPDPGAGAGELCAQSRFPSCRSASSRSLGGLTFAGVNGQPRELWKSNQNLIMPRIGFAYSLTPKTVLRGGYGIFFDALGVVNVNVNQTGFTQSTDLVPIAR